MGEIQQMGDAIYGCFELLGGTRQGRTITNSTSVSTPRMGSVFQRVSASQGVLLGNWRLSIVQTAQYW